MNCLFASGEVCRDGPYRTGGHDIEPKRRLICGEQNLSLADLVLNSVRSLPEFLCDAQGTQDHLRGYSSISQQDCVGIPFRFFPGVIYVTE
jgi:hypothetical protein